VKAECDHLEGLIGELRKAAPDGWFAEPVRIRSGASLEGRSFAEEVRRRLTDGTTWHIVHFAGRAWLDPQSGQGSFLVPGTSADCPVRLIPAEEMAAWLSSARLFYLSSCCDPSDRLVFSLAAQGIPAVAGFRWSIDDPMAAEFARCFYQELLTGSGSLQAAFLKARQELHARYSNDRVWISPLLALHEDDLTFRSTGPVDLRRAS
jgi:CHAT domain-containing protein